MRAGSAVYRAMGTTVFETMSRLAAEHGAVNLGQGFPDDRGPEDVIARAAEALVTGWNQYPSMLGLPELRDAIAEHERRFYGLSFDPRTEVLVTSGATEALAACILALVEPGDEVVLFEPAYDAYAPLVRRAGGTPRFVTLRPPDFAFDDAALAEVFSDRTKLVVLNNPQNPAGKVYTEAELDLVARWVERFDCYAVCDEVYEHIVFDGARHVPFVTRPGMARRSLKIGSAGKTFSLTGWKVGMVVGPAELLSLVTKAHQFLTFTTPPNLQTAVAFGLRKDDAYFASLGRELQRRRDRLSNGLRALGIDVLPARGAYFVNVDIRSLGFVGSDVDFCRHLVEHVGVAAIPLSAFYDGGPRPPNPRGARPAPLRSASLDERAPVTHLARLCFAKQDDVLDRAIARFARFAIKK